MARDPLFIVVAIACLAVLAVLLVGVGGFARGGEFNRKYANKIMRLRLLAAVHRGGADRALRLALAAAEAEPMVVLNRIYTRTGDKGETALGDGTRVAKDAPRVAAYGTVDELNATLGLARLHAGGERDAALARIQNDLFDLGADLCTPDFENDATAKHPRLRVVAAQVDAAGGRDRRDERRPRRRSAASCCPAARRWRRTCTSARTVCRRAERLTVALAAAEPVNPEAVRYLNRLSDWLLRRRPRRQRRRPRRRALGAGREPVTARRADPPR